MQNQKRCKRCILPDTLPFIKFDEEGICNHCREYERSFREWTKIKDKKEKEFLDLLKAAKKKMRAYDCLVPLSGGKDSTYVLYLCAKVYGMRCLAVTFDNGYMTPLAKENIDSSLKATNSDHIFYRINATDMNALFKTFLLKTGDFCASCMRAINFSIETIARTFKVPLIIKGSGKRVQYVSQIRLPKKSGSNSSFFFNRVIRGEKIEEKFRIFRRNSHSRMEWFKIALLFRISPKFLMNFSPQAINLYDYIYKPYPEIINIIKNEMDWNSQADSFEHLDCHLHEIPFYIDTKLVDGITTETFHNSALIRQGIITREKALEIEEELQKNKKIPKELITFLEKNELTYSDFEKACTRSDPQQFVPRFEKFLRKIYQHMYYKRQ
ncbi:MAG: hypothetical protein JXI43_05735 [Tissierellales bacterium]|nr:hypothetical protein [Tissierellales bacterium]